MQPWRADRHPEGQTKIDTTRGHLYQWSGLACGNPTSGLGLHHSDLWRSTLDADPTANRWTRLAVATRAGVAFSASMVYVPGHDVIVLHGPDAGYFPETRVYCPTDGASLSARQMAAGCDAPNDWERTYNRDSVTPPLPGNNNLVYDPVTDRVLMFTMLSEGRGDWNTEVWAYDLPTRTWSNRNPANPPLNQQSMGTESTVAYVSSGPWAGEIIYHRTTH